MLVLLGAFSLVLLVGLFIVRGNVPLYAAVPLFVLAAVGIGDYAGFVGQHADAYHAAAVQSVETGEHGEPSAAAVRPVYNSAYLVFDIAAAIAIAFALSILFGWNLNTYRDIPHSIGMPVALSLIILGGLTWAAVLAIAAGG